MPPQFTQSILVSRVWIKNEKYKNWNRALKAYLETGYELKWDVIQCSHGNINKSFYQKSISKIDRFMLGLGNRYMQNQIPYITWEKYNY